MSGFRVAGTALHHKLCHVLGGSFDLPHAEVHTIVLPHATAYNRAGAPAAMARIALRKPAGDVTAGCAIVWGRRARGLRLSLTPHL